MIRKIFAFDAYENYIREDEEDCRRYLETLKHYLETEKAEALAWCLMSNHVHLLLHTDGLPDILMKKNWL